MSLALKDKTNDSDRDEGPIAEAYAELRRRAALLVAPDGRSRELPGSVLSFLLKLVGDLSARRSVAIVSSESTMTTVEACQLLESGAIPFHKVGTHRRIYAGDLFQYKTQRDQQRREAISRFSELERDNYLDS
jgi:excisionase family DNA binding protein